MYIRRQLRSTLVIMGVFAAIGTIYQPVTTGTLTLTGPLTGMIVGVPLVLFEIFFPMNFMHRWPFAAIVLGKSFLYIALILLAFLGTAFIIGLVQGLTLDDFYRQLWSSSTISKVAVASCAFVVIIFFRQLNRLLGPGTLMRYLFGAYYRPQREERIFMFLDLKDSTAIAERLEMDAYYALLNDFFHDIAEPVLATRAQIYQYVGDEVVLTWPMGTGLRDANCIRVFYEIDTVIRRHGAYYLARYGVIPEYKAGVHGGEVIRAEIGDLKRDLIYNGDVLNTTARIQSECNRLDARLLVSTSLFRQLLLPPDIVDENLGEIVLKGKQHPMGLVQLRQRDEATDPELRLIVHLRLPSPQPSPRGRGSKERE
jgi:adenylate cyclase